MANNKRYNIIGDFGYGDKGYSATNLTESEVRDYFVKHLGWTTKAFNEMGIEYFMDSAFTYYVEVAK